jgi:hypothetical protein
VGSNDQTFTAYCLRLFLNVVTFVQSLHEFKLDLRRQLVLARAHRRRI